MCLVALMQDDDGEKRRLVRLVCSICSHVWSAVRPRTEPVECPRCGHSTGEVADD